MLTLTNTTITDAIQRCDEGLAFCNIVLNWYKDDPEKVTWWQAQKTFWQESLAYWQKREREDANHE